MIVRIHYEAEGGHVRARVFTGNSASVGLSGTLMIRLEDWPAFRALMADAGCQIVSDKGDRAKWRKILQQKSDS